MKVSGVGEEGEIRIVELPENPFFLATLFLPQARSSAEAPHPWPRASRRRSTPPPGPRGDGAAARGAPPARG